MAELADAPDLGSGGEIHAGSIPVTRTNEKSPEHRGFLLVEKVLFLRVGHPVTAPTPTPPPKGGEGLYCEGTAYPHPAKGLRPLNLTRFFDRQKPPVKGGLGMAYLPSA